MNPRKRLIICSAKDVASVNICESLSDQGGWDDYGSDDLCTYRRRGDDLLMYLPEKHLYNDDLDKRAAALGFVPDVVIFPSVHSAKSGMAALTAHPIGNYNDAQYGGKERALVKAAPSAMSSALRSIRDNCKLPEFSICFEATHHGPWLETPTFFLEIGSDMQNWPRKDAADLLATVVRETADAEPFTPMFGVGGGHYAPRFTEVALGFKVDFGHMLPNYQMEGRDDEEISRMLALASEATGTEVAYLHRKSMKGAEAQRIRSLGESLGIEWVRSEDLEPLN